MVAVGWSSVDGWHSYTKSKLIMSPDRILSDLSWMIVCLFLSTNRTCPRELGGLACIIVEAAALEITSNSGGSLSTCIGVGT